MGNFYSSCGNNCNNNNNEKKNDEELDVENEKKELLKMFQFQLNTTEGANNINEEFSPRKNIKIHSSNHFNNDDILGYLDKLCENYQELSVAHEGIMECFK